MLGEAPFKFRNAVEAVKQLRQAPKASDQYLPPFVIADESGKPVGPIVDVDAVVTIHFRVDRMVMVAKAFEYEDFDKFDRVRVPKIRYAGMLQYDGELKLPSHYLVSPPEIDRTSGEYLVHNGIRTFACRLVFAPFICPSLLSCTCVFCSAYLLHSQSADSSDGFHFVFVFLCVCVFCIFFFLNLNMLSQTKRHKRKNNNKTNKLTRIWHKP